MKSTRCLYGLKHNWHTSIYNTRQSTSLDYFKTLRKPNSSSTVKENDFKYHSLYNQLPDRNLALRSSRSVLLFVKSEPSRIVPCSFLMWVVKLERDVKPGLPQCGQGRPSPVWLLPMWKSRLRLSWKLRGHKSQRYDDVILLPSCKTRLLVKNPTCILLLWASLSRVWIQLSTAVYFLRS